MTGLMRVEGGSAALPFVRMFCGCTVRIPLGGFVTAQCIAGSPKVHSCGEQGNALMPFALRMSDIYSALEEASAQLLPGEHLFAYPRYLHG